MNDSHQSAAAEVGPLVELLRCFAEGRVPFETQAAKRLISEAMQAQPGPTQERWCDWLIEAGRSLGVPLKAIDCSVLEAWELRNGGTTIAAWSLADHGPAVALLKTKGQMCRVRLCSDLAENVNLTSAKLARTLGVESRQSPLRWVFYDRHARLFEKTAEEYDEHAHTGHRHETPFRRFIQLIRPERGDIFVVLVVALMISFLVLATPIAGQELIRTVMFGNLYQPIVVLTLTLFCCLSCVAALQGLQILAAEIIQRRLFARVVADLSFRVPRLDYSMLHQTNGPELVNRFAEVVTVQKVIAGLLVDATSLVLTTAIGMTLLAFYHPLLLGYNLLLLFIMSIIIGVLGRSGVPTAISESVTKYQTLAWLEELARCPTAFRGGAGSSFAAERADRLVVEYLKARRAHFRVLIRQVLAILGLQAIASTVLLGLGGYLVMSEQLTLGQLVAAELIVTMIVGAFAKSIKHFEGWYDLMASLDKLGHLVDLPMEEQFGVIPPRHQQGMHVVCSQLSWTEEEPEHGHHGQESLNHRPGHHSIFEGVSFEVAPGGSLALFGPPGVGKSLVLDMLYGLRVPSSGRVAIDGFSPHDVRLDVLRSRAALVREREILVTSVYENVHFNRDDVDDDRVRQSLEVALLLDDVMDLPSGLQTLLAPSGAPLSETQAHRLMLARAVAGRPQLLLVDGLFDSFEDGMVSELIRRLRQDLPQCTLIVSTRQARIAALMSGRLAMRTLPTTAVAAVERHG